MEKEKVNPSDELREVMARLNDKLDKQLNGDVANDTFVKHIKKAVEKIVENRGMVDDMVKAGPLPEECKSADFKKGIDEFVREHDLVRMFEESKG